MPPVSSPPGSKQISMWVRRRSTPAHCSYGSFGLARLRRASSIVKSAVAGGIAPSSANRLRASRMYPCAVRSDTSQSACSQSPHDP
jgi:hypothetical protein